MKNYRWYLDGFDSNDPARTWHLVKRDERSWAKITGSPSIPTACHLRKFRSYTWMPADANGWTWISGRWARVCLDCLSKAADAPS